MRLREEILAKTDEISNSEPLSLEMFHITIWSTADTQHFWAVYFVSHFCAKATTEM